MFLSWYDVPEGTAVVVVVDLALLSLGRTFDARVFVPGLYCLFRSRFDGTTFDAIVSIRVFFGIRSRCVVTISFLARVFFVPGFIVFLFRSYFVGMTSDAINISGLV